MGLSHIFRYFSEVPNSAGLQLADLVVRPIGPDRSVDVMASPDGLGLTTPRIKVEVKHRTGSIGAPSIRSFVGALREGDSGLYEADRANVPVTLINMDELIVSYYDNVDAEGRVLLPLVRVY